jgi:hypothetical protein
MLYYKGDISALTLFCQQPDGALCFPPLPKLSTPMDEEQLPPEPVILYPNELINKVSAELQLDDELLIPEPGYFQQIETQDGIAMVYLARFHVLDPPHQQLVEHGCKLQTLTGLIGRSPAEMELLRRAYTYLMES